MALITDIQKLEPGGEIRLFEIDGTEYGADYLRFHGHAIPHTPEELLAYEHSEEDLPAKSIWWQGEEYAAWPVQIEGIGSSSDGTANPTDDPAKDQCKGCLSSCKLRFGENEELSHGGFPAVSLIARS